MNNGLAGTKLKKDVGNIGDLIGKTYKFGM